MSDILSSPCWVPATSVADPIFRSAYDLYVDERDQFGGWLMRHALKISADDFRVAMVTPEEMPVSSPTEAASKNLNAAKGGADTSAADTEKAAATQEAFPYMVAVPFTVTREVCDGDDDDGNTDATRTPRYMAESAAAALMDMATSFHIILAALPCKSGHVSLSIQANHMRRMECGRTYLLISRVDKMGRRIVYTSVEFVEATLPSPLPLGTTRELLTAMKSATVLANVKHVKSMLSFS
jgi:predicted thioesterase